MSDQAPANPPVSGRLSSPLVVLTLAEAVLLFLATSSWIGRFAVPYEKIGASPVQALLSLIGAASFALPTVIGFLCRSWRSAIVLPIGAWWLALIAHTITASAALKVAQIPYLYAVPIGNPRFTPFWLDSNATVALLLSFALFGTLGYLGWIARTGLLGER